MHTLLELSEDYWLDPGVFDDLLKAFLSKLLDVRMM